MSESKARKQLLRDIFKMQKWVADFENLESTFPWSKEEVEANALLLGTVLNFLPNPFYVIDVSNYMVVAANSAAQFNNFSRNCTCYALTHRTDRPCGSTAHPCPVDKIRETKQPVQIEHLHFDKDGNPQNVEIHAFPIFDRKENVTHVIEYVIDITARKQAEDALRWELAVNSSLSRLYGLMASPMSSIETITRIVLEQAKLLTGSGHGYVSEIDPATGDNILHAFSDFIKIRRGAFAKNGKLIFPRKKGKYHDSLWGRSLNGAKAFYINSPNELIIASRGLMETTPIHCFLSVPVMLGKELVGQITLVNKGTDYTEQELKAIIRLAGFYALAIQRKRTEDELSQAHKELEQRIEERTAELEKTSEERSFIREIFGTYMSDEVATKILQSPGGLKLGGEGREMSVLVSDLRDFSAASEAMEASEVVKLVNRYLEKMVPVIGYHEGTIDEFMGDGILVFFGAPKRLRDHRRRAVACALAMQKSMRQLNEENQALGLPQLGMGIGVSCGQLVVGNIGTEKRKKYGAVGAPIIAAFRLEKKARPGEVLITEGVKSKIKGLVEIGASWKDNLKGVGETTVYQVTGMKHKTKRARPQP